MGTDIHGVFQRRTSDGEWRDVPSNFEENRHYQLFAVLADVRNGYGFAGSVTGEPVIPIAEPRGVPSDFIWYGDSHPVSKDSKEGEDGCGTVWMGDHSHSWLTSTEILEYAERAPVKSQCGIVSWAEWQTWDRKHAPTSYCGGISGPGVLIISRPEAESGKTGTHVQVSWQSPLKKELAYFFDEVARLHALHGEIRYVFGFDS